MSAGSGWSVPTPFSDAEMEDPVLRSRSDLRNPCRVFGPLTLEFYTGLLGVGRP
jgi:hypothetical protein